MKLALPLVLFLLHALVACGGTSFYRGFDSSGRVYSGARTRCGGTTYFNQSNGDGSSASGTMMSSGSATHFTYDAGDGRTVYGTKLSCGGYSHEVSGTSAGERLVNGANLRNGEVAASGLTTPGGNTNSIVLPAPVAMPGWNGCWISVPGVSPLPCLMSASGDAEAEQEAVGLLYLEKHSKAASSDITVGTVLAFDTVIAAIFPLGRRLDLKAGVRIRYVEKCRKVVRRWCVEDRVLVYRVFRGDKVIGYRVENCTRGGYAVGFTAEELPGPAPADAGKDEEDSYCLHYIRNVRNETIGGQ